MNEDGPEYSETLNIMDLNLGRTAEPESTDGHVGYTYILIADSHSEVRMLT